MLYISIFLVMKRSPFTEFFLKTSLSGIFRLENEITSILLIRKADIQMPWYANTVSKNIISLIHSFLLLQCIPDDSVSIWQNLKFPDSSMQQFSCLRSRISTLITPVRTKIFPVEIPCTDSRHDAIALCMPLDCPDYIFANANIV